jgi:hypothetical protein
MRCAKQRVVFLLAACALLSAVHADYSLGAKHRVQDDAVDFEVIELSLGNQFAGFIPADSKPMAFSGRFLVYRSCRIDRSTMTPEDSCTSWNIYDAVAKSRRPLTLPGLTFSSVPSFSWPYIAYVKVPEKIGKADFRRGLVDVACVVIEWPSRRIVAQQAVKVNVGHFETDAPGSFHPPRFVVTDGVLRVTCSEYNGKDDGRIIATLQIPR